MPRFSLSTVDGSVIATFTLLNGQQLNMGTAQTDDVLLPSELGIGYQCRLCLSEAGILTLRRFDGRGPTRLSPPAKISLGEVEFDFTLCVAPAEPPVEKPVQAAQSGTMATDSKSFDAFFSAIQRVKEEKPHLFRSKEPAAAPILTSADEATKSYLESLVFKSHKRNKFDFSRLDGICPILLKVISKWESELSFAERKMWIAPLIPRLLYSGGAKELEELRRWMALDWIIRVGLPAFLQETRSLRPYSDLLRYLPPQIDRGALEDSTGVRIAVHLATNVARKPCLFEDWWTSAWRRSGGDAVANVAPWDFTTMEKLSDQKVADPRLLLVPTGSWPTLELAITIDNAIRAAAAASFWTFWFWPTACGMAAWLFLFKLGAEYNTGQTTNSFSYLIIFGALSVVGHILHARRVDRRADLAAMSQLLTEMLDAKDNQLSVL